MVSGAGRHHPESDPAHLCQLPTAVVPGAAGGGSRVRLRQDGGDVLRPAASGAGVVDVHAPGGGRADQQRGGARLPACGAVAAEQPRDGERGGESVRGTDPDGGGHLSATRSPRVGLSDGVLPSGPAWRSPSVAPTVVTTRKRTPSCPSGGNLWEVPHDASDDALGQAVVDLLDLSGEVDAAPARGREEETERLWCLYGLDGPTPTLAKRVLTASVTHRHGRKSWVVQTLRYDP